MLGYAPLGRHWRLGSQDGKKEEISFGGLINWLPRKQGYTYQGCLYKVFRWVSFFACYLLNNGIRYFIKGKYIVPLFWCLITRTLCTLCTHQNSKVLSMYGIHNVSFKFKDKRIMNDTESWLWVVCRGAFLSKIHNIQFQ